MSLLFCVNKDIITPGQRISYVTELEHTRCARMLLKENGLGCHMNDQFVGTFIYADDITLPY